MDPVEIPAEIRRMPVPDRLVLVGKIWDSIVEDGLPPLSEEQRHLLDERLAALESNPGEAEAWDKVRAEVFGEQ